MNEPLITEEELHAYVDDLLESRRRLAVEGYLSSHPDVKERILRYASQREALRQALAPIVEEPIPPELDLEHLAQSRQQILAARWRLGRAAALAAVLLGLGGAGGWLLRGASLPPQSGIGALAREAVDAYEVYGPDHVHPVQIRAVDRDELIRWITLRMGLSVSVPDLSASGFRFMGGSMLPTPHGPAALFMYDNDHGMRLVVLTRFMQHKDRIALMSQHDSGPLTSFAWADKGIGYSLVGPITPQALHHLADKVRQQIIQGI